MSDHSARNPSPPPLTESEIEKVHGDFIKDTVFSKRWVLDILLKLYKQDNAIYSKVEVTSADKEDEDESSKCTSEERDLDKDFENDLCQLWDMTANSEVALFLTEHDCKDVLLHALRETQSPRLMEICFGIFGNLFCVKEILISYSESQDFRMQILNYLSITDALSLVELTRVLCTSLSCSSSHNLWLLDLCDAENKFVEQLVYLLGNSLNTSLLVNVIEILDAIFDFEDECIDSVVNTEFIFGMIDALKLLKEDGKTECMITLVHVMQLISTSNKGLEILLSETEKLFDFLEICIDIFVEKDNQELSSGEHYLFYASMMSCFTCILPTKKDLLLSILNGHTVFLKLFINYLHNTLEEIHDSGKDEKQSTIACVESCVECFCRVLEVTMTTDSSTKLKDFILDDKVKKKILAIENFISKSNIFEVSHEKTLKNFLCE